jgi:DTW domain-containing protein YfiP
LKNEILEQKFEGFALLYPIDESAKTPSQPLHFESQRAEHTEAPTGYIWIDATWQESRKMLRQSPWLNKLPKYQVNRLTSKNLPDSQYALRRNQTTEGLCTMETFAYWLDEKNHPKSARDLLNFFNQFQSAFLKARNSGLFK